ncbi:MAG: hypothetical protein ACFCVH_04015 [Alphaproteobacteria bacterium]
MTDTAVPSVETASLRIDGHKIWTIMLAGAVATVAFDVFGQSLSPMLGFPKLAPVALADSVIGALVGGSYAPGAVLLHVLTGLIAYPVGWLFIAQPIARRLLPDLPWWVSAIAYGVALWTFALFVMAHLVAGNPAFLGFTAITWTALAGHVLFALVAAAVVRWRQSS